MDGWMDLGFKFCFNSIFSFFVSQQNKQSPWTNMTLVFLFEKEREIEINDLVFTKDDSGVMPSDTGEGGM